MNSAIPRSNSSNRDNIRDSHAKFNPRAPMLDSVHQELQELTKRSRGTDRPIIMRGKGNYSSNGRLSLVAVRQASILIIRNMRVAQAFPPLEHGQVYQIITTVLVHRHVQALIPGAQRALLLEQDLVGLTIHTILAALLHLLVPAQVHVDHRAGVHRPEICLALNQLGVGEAQD